MLYDIYWLYYLTTQLILRKEMIMVCCRNYMKLVNILFGHNANSFIVKYVGKVQPRTSHEGPEGE